MNYPGLLRNVLSAAGQTILQTGILFVAYRYLIDHLGIQRLGVWSVVLATTSVARVSELGLAGSVVRFVATHRAAGNDAAARATIQTAAVAVATILAGVLVVLHPALNALIPRLLPHEGVADATSILAYALFSMWLSAVSSVWLAGLDAYLRSDLRAILVVASTCVFAATLPATVPTYGLVGLALSQVIQGVLLLLAGWAIVRGVVPDLPLLPVEWKYARLREMVAYGANLQVMAIVMLLFDPTTKVLLARFGGLSATGYFELAQQLVTKARALIVESNRVVVPVIAGLNEGGGTLRFYTQNARLLSFLVIPFFSILAAATPLISELWIGRIDRQFVTMVLSITAAWYVNALTAPAYFAYLGQGNLGWLTFSHTVMGIGNVALGLILGPALGWTGVIAAFVISLSTGSLVPLWAFHREHGLPMRSMLHASDMMMALACTAIATLAILAYLSPLVDGGRLWMKVAVPMSAAAVVLAAMLRHPLGPEVLTRLKSATSGRPAAL